MLVIHTGLCSGGACVVVMGLTAMDMAIVPIVEFLDWRWRVSGALGKTVAISAVEGHTTALGIPAILAVASVESILPAAIVGATTAAAVLSLLALVLLLATLAASCLTSLVGLLWVLKHACRGLVSKCVAEHLD
jgi:hypothetical protein